MKITIGKIVIEEIHFESFLYLYIRAFVREKKTSMRWEGTVLERGVADIVVSNIKKSQRKTEKYYSVLASQVI